MCSCSAFSSSSLSFHSFLHIFRSSFRNFLSVALLLALPLAGLCFLFFIYSLLFLSSFFLTFNNERLYERIHCNAENGWISAFFISGMRHTNRFYRRSLFNVFSWCIYFAHSILFFSSLSFFAVAALFFSFCMQRKLIYFVGWSPLFCCCSCFMQFFWMWIVYNVMVCMARLLCRFSFVLP